MKPLSFSDYIAIGIILGVITSSSLYFALLLWYEPKTFLVVALTSGVVWLCIWAAWRSGSLTSKN